MPDPIDAHIGGRLRLLRARHGMSQQDLARALGLSFQQVQKYEKGMNRIGSGRLYRISEIFQVAIQYFFEEIPADHKTSGQALADKQDMSKMDEMLWRREGLRLNQAYASISDDSVRKRVLDLIVALGSNEE
jgi:transcriptional regulator with XRE-family HTH domain